MSPTSSVILDVSNDCGAAIVEAYFVVVLEYKIGYKATLSCLCAYICIDTPWTHCDREGGFREDTQIATFPPGRSKVDYCD